MISSDLAATIGSVPEINDTIYRISGVGGSEFVYSKKVDAILVGNMKTDIFELEIGAMNYGFDLDGIIGLDLLARLKSVRTFEKRWFWHFFNLRSLSDNLKNKPEFQV